MFAKGQTVIQFFEEYAPRRLAFEGDKIGLHVGTLNKEVKKVLVTLDVLEEVVDEAIELNVDLIIAHHAVIFRPLKTLRTDLPQGKLYEKLIKNDIAVYTAHTNLDIAWGGINDLMADALGLKNTKLLDTTYTDPEKNVVCGIGRIGQLDEPVSLREFALRVKEAFDVKGVRVVGNLESSVQKVAVLGGDGNSYVGKAAFQGADVLVTGDVYYHTAHDALADGLSLVDPGHNVEKVMKAAVQRILSEKLQQAKYKTEVVISGIHTDPFQFL